MSETKKERVELTKAILKVMQDVKGIEKSLTVGSGNFAYKGVSDQEVKKVIGRSMAENGLAILQVAIEPVIKIDRWEAQEMSYGKPVVKQKQSVFTEVKVTYLLMHEGGGSQEIIGYGHGVDAMDKSAGKATTYALKYALLYTFLVPTGAIDDSDAVHSENIEEPVKQLKTDPIEEKIEKKVSLSKEKFDKCIKGIEANKYTTTELKDTFILTAEQRKEVDELEIEIGIEELAGTIKEKK